MREVWCDRIIEMAYHICVRKSTCLSAAFLKAKPSGASLSSRCHSLDFFHPTLLCSALLHRKFLVSGGLASAWIRKRSGSFVRNMLSILKKDILMCEALNHGVFLPLLSRHFGWEISSTSQTTLNWNYLEAVFMWCLLWRLPGHFRPSLCNPLPCGFSAKAVPDDF